MIPTHLTGQPPGSVWSTVDVSPVLRSLSQEHPQASHKNFSQENKFVVNLPVHDRTSFLSSPQPYPALFSSHPSHGVAGTSQDMRLRCKVHAPYPALPRLPSEGPSQLRPELSEMASAGCPAWLWSSESWRWSFKSPDCLQKTSEVDFFINFIIAYLK